MSNFTQDQLKQLAAAKAVEFVPENEYIGIGTGSTVNPVQRSNAFERLHRRRG